jgi:DNA mismatch repair protein MutS
MSATPMMKQYQDAKAACPDALLLFRMGDFYETFYEDAKTAARVLNLALTSRDKGDNPIPLAGFPYHQLESYLAKLIAAGLRVAICDQVEDARQAKGLVRREVTRIVTAGTVTDDALLDPRASNYLAAVAAAGDTAGLAWVELSTGRFHAACIPAARLADELARIHPAECVVSEETQLPAGALDPGQMLTRRAVWSFSLDTARDALLKHFGIASLEGFGFDDADGPAIRAAGAVLAYLLETQKASLGHIDTLVRYSAGATLEIDAATRRSLEITGTLREARREGSLLGVMDRTVTAMGSRLLADWLDNPLTEIDRIEGRLDAVDELVADAALTQGLQDQLRGIYDLERLLARVTTGRSSPRDLSFIGRTLRGLPQIKARITARRSTLVEQLEGQLDLCCDVRAELERALADDCPLTSREGGFMREGFSAELDALRELTRGGKQWIAKYQAEESQRAGIGNLKVGFNQVFGYYLEITNAHSDKIPAHYIRKQTVKNAERFITPELKEYEERVLTADEKSRELEYNLFVELRQTVARSVGRLQRTAGVLAQLDVLVSLADLARHRAYCRPSVVAEPVLHIVDGRHPVLDALIAQGSFVPNDTQCGPDDGFSLLITGPNMAGKSTFIRQVALIALMSQVGSFVPARQATLGVADRIFARVGASDELARGQSTFMVEMTETARILNTATSRSLVILDEIGRGTSTYDGLSLAWAVVEYLHDRVGCRTLFATHYHELTSLSGSLAGLRNYNVAVREWQDDVVFLHKILPGAADKSYGIHVARLAGVPPQVVERAKQILAQLEDQRLGAEGRAQLARPTRKLKTADLQLTLFAAAEHPLVGEVRALKLDETTPLAALKWLEQWQAQLEDNRGKKM